MKNLCIIQLILYVIIALEGLAVGLSLVDIEISFLLNLSQSIFSFIDDIGLPVPSSWTYSDKGFWFLVIISVITSIFNNCKGYLNFNS